MTAPPPRPRRPNPRSELAQIGESLAAATLQQQGFRIEALNLRTRDGEIDLLVRKGGLWVAVEVKTRRHDQAPERAVREEQRLRITRALAALGAVLRPRPKRMRVDVVAVRIRPDRSHDLLHFPGREFDPPPC
ncbi:MAG: YraN family protein [Planctomycetota bacterium]